MRSFGLNSQNDAVVLSNTESEAYAKLSAKLLFKFSVKILSSSYNSSGIVFPIFS